MYTRPEYDYSAAYTQIGRRMALIPLRCIRRNPASAPRSTCQKIIS
jgi:hypothetical protein